MLHWRTLAEKQIISIILCNIQGSVHNPLTRGKKKKKKLARIYMQYSS